MTALWIEPCPFCGETSIGANRVAREYVSIEPAETDGALSVCMDGDGWYWVTCCNCHATGPRYYGEGRGKPCKGPRNHARDADATRTAIGRAVGAWNLREPVQERMGI